MRCVRSYQDIPADPREKRIAELEAYNKKLLQSDIDNHNKIFLLSQKVNDLQKENTKLKTDYEVLSCSVDDFGELQNKLEEEQRKNNGLSDNLTKAKEKISNLLEIIKRPHQFTAPRKIQMVREAEQFLSEVEK